MINEYKHCINAVKKMNRVIEPEFSIAYLVEYPMLSASSLKGSVSLNEKTAS